MRKFRSAVESVTPPPTDCLWIHNKDVKCFINGEWESLISDEDNKELEEKVDSLDKEMGDVKNQLDKIDASTVVLELEIGDSDEVKARNLAKLAKVEHTFMADIDYGYGTADWLPASGGQATITTAEGIKVFYKINTDGSVVKLGEYNGGLIITSIGKVSDTFYNLVKSVNIVVYLNRIFIRYNENFFKCLDYFIRDSNVVSNVIFTSTINQIDYSSYFIIPNATKSNRGLVKAITNIADVTDSANLMGAFNTLLAQMRNAGMIDTTSTQAQTLEAPEGEIAVDADIPLTSELYDGMDNEGNLIEHSENETKDN